MFRPPSIALAACAALFPALASAQSQQCGDRAAVVETLAQRYGESPRSIGLTAQGQVVETFASDESGSWTITVTFPDGRMCLVASGMAFETIEAAVLPSGAPA